MRALVASCALGFCALTVTCAQPSRLPKAHILQSHSWATYGFDFANTRHVRLSQINKQTVSALRPAWRFLTKTHGRLETSPIVFGDTMYLTIGANSSVVALDAVTGKLKWQYVTTLGTSFPCCGLVNRGVAIDGGRVFFATLDAHLIALDARTGRLLWRQTIGDPKSGLTETMAPLAWRGKVFIGSSGGELGIRGSFTAYTAANGRMVWRWWAVSPGWEGSYVQRVHGVSLHRDIAQEKRDAPRYRNAWRHGGGPVWMTPALDERRSTIYLSTGNAAPVYRSDLRPGDNLYTDSIVALDARTGKMQWYYQETPHDPGDHDAASPPVLIDALDRGGKRVPAVGEAGKTGWFYSVDRANGGLIRVSQNFVPIWDVYARVPPSGGTVRPGTLGGAIAPVATNPDLHLVFIDALDLPQQINPAVGALGLGNYQAGKVSQHEPGEDFICAIDIDNGTIVWRRHLASGHYWMLGGPLSTSDLVFVPEPTGAILALDALNGRTLWRYQVGANRGDVSTSFGAELLRLAASIKHTLTHQPQSITAHLNAPPIAYELNGREYIAVAADIAPGANEGGDGIMVFSLP